MRYLGWFLLFVLLAFVLVGGGQAAMKWWEMSEAVDGAVIQASNVAIMAIPTMGESWHGNHHAFPSSARHGLYPGQVDIGFRFIQLLELLGLAWNVRVPANLPPRAGLTPLTARALSAVSADQARVSSDVRA